MRMLLTLLLASAPGVAIPAGHVRFFAPGQLRPGTTVTCLTRSGPLTMRTPPPSTAGSSGSIEWTKGGAQASIQSSANGAVEIACGTTLAPQRFPDVPYVLGRNGLGLIRGTSTLAGVRKLFGGTTAAGAGSCRLTSFSLGLAATFAGSCAPGARFVSATVTGSRWSSLDGVRIGDSVARMRWQDAPARLFAKNLWLLGGRGAKTPPRLLARVANGRVVAFVIRTR